MQAPDCRIVLLVGLSLMIVPVVVMCCFNDDKSLGESSEAKRYKPQDNRPASAHPVMIAWVKPQRPECIHAGRTPAERVQLEAFNPGCLRLAHLPAFNRLVKERAQLEVLLVVRHLFILLS